MVNFTNAIKVFFGRPDLSAFCKIDFSSCWDVERIRIMNGNKYFSILDDIFSIEKKIDELLKDSYSNEREFLLKVKKRVNTLEKFTVKNWLEYKKDEEKL